MKSNKILAIVVVLALVLAGVLLAGCERESEHRASQAGVYHAQGGDKLIVQSGGEIEVQSGGTFDLQAGATTDFSSGIDLDGGLLDLVRRNAFQPDERVLFWHTGGTTGLFGYGDELL